MAVVNLTQVGNTQLGGTGPVKLADIVASRYTRTPGYLRVNPFEVAKNHAPSEEVAPHSLNDWESYDHDSVDSGNDLNMAATGGYGGLNIVWVKHAGYANAPSLLRTLVYFKSMGTTQDLSVNPFSTPDGTDDAGDASSYTIAGLTVGDWYAIGVKVEFDDGVTLHINGDGLACDPHASATPLLGAVGISSGFAVYDQTPISISATQTTDPETCTTPDPVNISISWSVDGPSQVRLEESQNGGAFTFVANYSAGSSGTNLSRASGNTWRFRIRYVDVSPESFRTQTGSTSAICNLS